MDNTFSNKFLKDLVAQMGIVALKGLLLGILITIILGLVEKAPSFVEKVNTAYEERKASVAEEDLASIPDQEENQNPSPTENTDKEPVSPEVDIASDDIISDTDASIDELKNILCNFVLILGVFFLIFSSFRLARSIADCDEYERNSSYTSMLGGILLMIASFIVRAL